MINGTNKLDTVKQAFRHWRATRTKRGQIPDELWGQVKGLLGDYTQSKIGSHLGISPNQIRKKLLPVEKTDLQFVEVKGKPWTFWKLVESLFLFDIHLLCNGSILLSEATRPINRSHNNILLTILLSLKHNKETLMSYKKKPYLLIQIYILSFMSIPIQI